MNHREQERASETALLHDHGYRNTGDFCFVILILFPDIKNVQRVSRMEQYTRLELEAQRGDEREVVGEEELQPQHGPAPAPASALE